MDVAALRSLRLTAFKSFRDVTVPIEKLTVLTGRNSSGKSNVLDGFEVLSRLAGGEDLRDALDGRRREGGPIRGGSRGCAPHGLNYFTLGCDVSLGQSTYQYDVTVQVDPELRITEERLIGPAPDPESGVAKQHRLLLSRPPGDPPNQIWWYDLPCTEHAILMTASQGNRLMIAALSEPPAHRSDERPNLDRSDENVKRVIQSAKAVVAALRGVFHLDPVPHLMRDYVDKRDADLRRTGENLSAAITRLRETDRETFHRLTGLLQGVADERVSGIELAPAALGEVMLALREGMDDHQVTPAREMSDGLLRFMAIATALLTADRGLDVDGTGSGPETSSGVLLVIEEVENGLHPSQAARILSLIRETSQRQGVQVALTTHSPALLNALPGELNRNVLVCYRDPDTGYSKLSRLTELPGYAEAMASGRLGDVVAADRMVRPEETSGDFSEFNRLLGIE